MSTGKGYFSRFNRRFLPGDRDHREDYQVSSDSALELSESDIYNSGRADSPEFRKPAKKPSVKRLDSSNRTGRTPASLPVNVPDWSKILRDAYDNKRRAISDEEEGGSSDDEGEAKVPPHEFLARKRSASFSVHEGIGRTLKGRDLSRVRDAIWEKTGFQD